MPSPVYKLERRRQLEAILILRKQEVESYRQHKLRVLQQLHALSIDPSKSRSPANTDNAPLREEEERHLLSPLTLPILRHCDNSNLPFYNNDEIHMVAAAETLNHYSSLLESSNARKELELEALTREKTKVAERIDEVLVLTGAKVKNGIVVLPEASGRKNMADPPSEDAIKQVKLLQRKVKKEIRMSEVIIAKKNRVIDELYAILEKRFAVVENTHQLQNDIHHFNQQIQLRKAALRETMEQHEALDKLLDAVRKRKEQPSSILDREAGELKSELKLLIDTDKRSQERVSKAQEYRSDVLQKRISTVRACLAQQNLDVVVSHILGEYHSETESLQQAGLVVRTDRDELYDIDVIIPPNEKVHPAIYRLLHDEKLRRAKVVGTLRVILRERDESIDALAHKVGELAETFERSTKHLMKASMTLKLENEKQRSEVQSLMEGNKRRYGALLTERVRLRRKLMLKRAKEKEGMDFVRPTWMP